MQGVGAQRLAGSQAFLGQGHARHGRDISKKGHRGRQDWSDNEGASFCGFGMGGGSYAVRGMRSDMDIRLKESIRDILDSDRAMMH